MAARKGVWRMLRFILSLLVCVNAQVMYYPTRVGTLRGADCTPEERARWPATERQRHRNVAAMFDAGVDPYAVLLALEGVLRKAPERQAPVLTRTG